MWNGFSAGAAFGCNYKSRQIGRVLRYNKRFCRDRRYSGLHSLITSGNIYNTDFCYGEVPLKYDVFDFETYTNNPMEFHETEIRQVPLPVGKMEKNPERLQEAYNIGRKTAGQRIEEIQKYLS